MKKLTTKSSFRIAAAFAFLAMIMFFNINSTFGDAHNFNGLKGFLGLGILSTVSSLFFMYLAVKKAN
jgi:hypothetical protein